jgi:hypothetical protein
MKSDLRRAAQQRHAADAQISLSFIHQRFVRAADAGRYVASSNASRNATLNLNG